MDPISITNEISSLSRRRFLSTTAVTATSILPVIGSGRQPTQNEPVFSESYPVSGLVSDLSESGDLVLFGFSDGNVMVVNNDQRDAVVPSGIDSSISHIIVREDTDTAVLGLMDAGYVGTLDLIGDNSDFIEYPDLWDIDATSDASTIASVSQPTEGAGSVAVTTEDGEIQWESSLDDAVGISVAIADTAEYVAVAAGEMWTNAEAEGTAGVGFYNDEGSEEWVHEPDEDVVSISVDADRELVAAGTEFGTTIVLDFDGNEIWETDEYGGQIALSGDGSTLVADSVDTLYAINSETNEEEWSTDLGFIPFDPPQVSTDGSRVLVSNQSEGVITVFEEGEMIWERTYDIGPAIGTLSGSGSVWSVSVQNNEPQTGRVEIYRDSSDTSRQLLPTKSIY
jgi:hypothetical protein